MTSEPAAVIALVAREHRRLDDLLGRSLQAFASGEVARVTEALTAFDDALRKHTALEEEHLYGRTAGKKLVAGSEEPEAERLARELSIEHVQIREVSGMILRLLTEKGDGAGARALLPNLLRRWDAHTTREEGELQSLVPPDRVEELLAIFSAVSGRSA